MLIFEKLFNYTSVLLLTCSIVSCATLQTGNKHGDPPGIGSEVIHDARDGSIILSIDLIIERPVEEVFAYLIDPSTVPEWQADISRQVNITDGPMRVGTILLNSKKSIWGDYEYEREIMDFVPSKTFSFYSHDKSLEFKMSYVLQSVNSRTKISVIGEFKKTETSLYRYIPQVILKYGIKRVFLNHNKLLKKNIEKETKRIVQEE